MKKPGIGKDRKIEDNINKDVKNIFRPKKEIDDIAIKLQEIF